MRTIRSILVAIVMAATALSTVTVLPASAATTKWDIGGGSPEITSAYGNLIWHNRSVTVGGLMWVEGWCSAVVFNGYDGNNVRRARETRPKDNEYYCPGNVFGFEFTLDPGNIAGGIQRIEINLWKRDPDTGWKYLAQVRNFYRP